MINNFSGGSSGKAGASAPAPSVPSVDGYYTDSGFVSSGSKASSRSSSSGGGSLTFGGSGSSGGGISSSSIYGDAPSVPTLSASSKGQAPPQRLDVNDLYASVAPNPGRDFIASLGNVPAQTYESPVSTLNVLTGAGVQDSGTAVIGGKTVHLGRQTLGLGDQISQTIGSIPGLGALVGGAGDLVRNLQGIAPNIRNQADIDALKGVAKYPDSTPIINLPSNLLVPLASRYETVGQFRNDMKARGLSVDMAGLNLADKPTSSAWGTDILTRLAGDPTNLLLPAGGPINAARAIGNVGKGVVDGIGLADKLAAAGKALPQAVDAATSAEKIGQGASQYATLAGLGTYIQKALAVTDKLPSVGQIAGAYTKAAIANEVALGVTNLTTDALQKNLPQGPWSPALQGLHDFSQQVLDNKPFSNNAAFSLVAAYSLPLHQVTNVIKKPIDVAFATVKGGGGAENAFVNAVAPDNLSFAEKKSWVHDQYGGKTGIAQAINWIDNAIAYDKVVGPDIRNPRQPALTNPHLVAIDQAASVDELAAAKRQFAQAIADYADRMRKDGRISNQMRTDKYRQWFGKQAGIADAQIEDVRRYSQPWDPAIAAETWQRYRDIGTAIGNTLIDRGDVIVGLQDTLYTEHVQQVHDLFSAEARANNGIVPFKAFQQIVNRYPQLIANDATDYFVQKLATGEGVSIASLRGKTTALMKDAVPLDTVTHEMAGVERNAPKIDPTPTGSMTDQAVVEPNGNGPMTPQYADNVLGQGSPQRVNGSDIQAAYDNGNYGLGQDLNRQLGIQNGGSVESGGAVKASPEVAMSPDRLIAEGMTPAEATDAIAHTQLVPLSFIKGVAEAGRNDLVRGSNPQVDEYLNNLKADIAANGFRAPVDITYNPETGLSDLNGNHRLLVAQELGLDSIPAFVRVYRYDAGLTPRAPTRPIDTLPNGTIVQPMALFGDNMRSPTIQDTAPIRAAADASALGPEIAAENVQRDVAAAKAISDQTGLAWGRGSEAIDQGKRADLADLQKFVQQFPGYRVVKQPALANILTDAPPAIAEQVLQQNALWEWLNYSGPTAPVARMVELLTAKPTSGSMAQAARQAVYNELLPQGATVRQVNTFFKLIRDATQLHQIHGIPLFRTYSALTPKAIETLAEEAFGPKTAATLKEATGGLDRVLDRAHNRVYQAALRNVDRGTRGTPADSQIGALARAAEKVYTTWQDSPTGAIQRFGAKTIYPLFRFFSDPRWWLMNEYEIDTLGSLKYGMGSTRYGKDIPMTPANVVHNPAYGIQTAKQVADAAAQRIVDGEDVGQAFGHRHIASIVNRTFEKDVRASIDATLNELSQKDPVYADLKARFGENPAAWSDQVYNTLYALDGGIRNAITTEAERAGLAQYDKALAPFYDRLYQVHSQAMKDLRQVMEGNHSRSNLERIANHPLLYWPLSYQLKAAKWLFDVMTVRSFGHATNFGGAYTLANVEDTHKRMMASNPAYAAVFTEHPALWQLAQQLIPITPWDLGVSLSRPIRYAGGWLGWWGAYKSAQTPQAAIDAITQMGPAYSAKLLKDALDEFGVFGGKPSYTITVPKKSAAVH